MLLEVFIILKETSFLLVRRSFIKDKQIRVDGQLFSGLISAISSFIEEIDIGNIHHFETGNRRVLISPYKGIVIVAIVEEKREEPFVENSIKKIAEDFWNKFHKTFDESLCDVAPYEKYIPEIDKIVYNEFTKAYISKDFPKHMIKVVRNFQTKFDPNILTYMGKKVGEERAEEAESIKDFKKSLRKELDLFSIHDINENSKKEMIIKISMCPICRQIKDPSFSCNFITGFIDGFSSSSFPDKQVEVDETQCIAHGDRACVFNLIIE